jgi:predicted RNase H-like HicB family nuclease
MTLSDYLRLPWTVERTDHNDDGEYLVLHVRELPGFVVAARTADEADEMFWDALREFLRSYVDAGEAPPVPEAMLPEPPQLELLPVGTMPPRTNRTNTHEIRVGASTKAQFAQVLQAT